MRLVSLKLTFFLIAVGIAAPGCSISYSLGKSSDSVGSISESSSPSDSAEIANQTYRSDLSNFTVVAVKSGESAEGFLRGLSHVAEEFGITDWERERVTYLGIGAGLRQAGVKEPDIIQLGFIKTLTAQEPQTMSAILEGYRS